MKKGLKFMFKELVTEIKRRGIIPGLGGNDNGLIQQNPEELANFIVFINEIGIKKYLEIGTNVGATFDFMVEFVGLDGWGIDNDKPKFQPDRIFVGNCNSDDAIKFAESHGPYDLVFIDADHHYESVKRDANNYIKMTKKIIAFHDICGLRTCEGAKKYWEEISVKYQTKKTFISKDVDKMVGIGAIVLI